MRADGTWTDIHDRAYIARDASGKAWRVVGAMLDLTERKRAETALRQKEAELSQAQRVAHIGSWHWDAATDATTGSDELLRIYGLDPATQRMLSFQEQRGRCYPVQEWERLNATVQRTLETGVGYELDVEAIRDATTIWITTRCEVVRDANGQIVGLHGTVQDITKRKRAEQSASLLAGELQALLDTAPIAIWIAHDPACRRITGNASADRLFQTPRSANISASAPAGEAAVSYKVLRDGIELKPEQMPAQLAAATGKPVTGEELDLVFADGRTVHLIESAVPLFDTQGQVRGAVIAGADITQRKRMEQALRQSDERFRIALQNTPITVATMDCELRYTWVHNTRHGFTPESVIGKRPDQLILPEDVGELMTLLQHVLETGVPESREVSGRTQGVRWDYYGVAEPLRDKRGEVVGLTVAQIDITERKRAERQLKELNETLEKRVAERTAVAEMRSEQLRMLAQELTQAEQRERQRIAHILHEHFQQLLVGAKFNLSMVQARDADSQESLRRTDQVLTEAVEASRSLAVELSPPILHYGGLAPALGWLGHWMHGKHGLKVEVVAEPHVPLPAEDVQVLLFQAARELLFNVVKHARVDRAKVELQQEPGWLLRLSVSDKGAGFHADALVTKACAPGGFGLFSIRERLSFLEGRVEIQSAPGTGTCISLLVPLPPTMQASALAGAAADRPATASAEKADGAAGLPTASAARIRVLIADDHAIVRDGLSRLLQMQPDMAVVGVARDGREAVELALRLRPDVVIMDVSMPERSGIEATRCILADLPATRIIGLSMHTDQDVADQMRQAGVAAYLAKTGPTDGLVAAIHASVRRT